MAYFELLDHKIKVADVTGLNAWVKAPFIIDPGTPLSVPKINGHADIPLPQMEPHAFERTYSTFSVPDYSVTVIPDEHVDLIIGTYCDVTLGGDTFGNITVGMNSNLTFLSNDIYIERLHFEGGQYWWDKKRVKFPENTTLHVKNKMIFGQFFEFNPDLHQTVVYIGSLDAAGNEIPGKLEITGNFFAFNAHVYAKDGTIDVNRSTAVYIPPGRDDSPPLPVIDIMRGKFIAGALLSVGQDLEWYGDLCTAQPPSSKQALGQAFANGVDEPTKEGDLLVFPNPNKGSFRIRYKVKDSYSPVFIHIYNSFGQLIQLEKFHEPGLMVNYDFDKNALNKQLAAGMIFIKVTNGGHIYSSKVEIIGHD